MSLTVIEKDACKLLLSQIKSDYLSEKLTKNSLGLTARDLYIPFSKFSCAVEYLKTGIPRKDKILKGDVGGAHEFMYIVSGNNHLDITGHVKNSQGIDKTVKLGGKAGAALFNVHVTFTGVSDAVKKELQKQIQASNELKKKFKEKMEIEQKQASQFSNNPFAALDEGDF